MPKPVTSNSVCDFYSAMVRSSNDVLRHSALKRWYQWEERLSYNSTTWVGDSTTNYPMQLVTCLVNWNAISHLTNVPDENYILKTLENSHIPGTIVHGRYDMICKQKRRRHSQSGPQSQLKLSPTRGTVLRFGIGYALPCYPRHVSLYSESSK